MILVLIGWVLFFGCSEDIVAPEEQANDIRLAIAPACGTPGTPIKVLGLDTNTVEVGLLAVYIGGEAAPFLFDRNGDMHTCIPMFLGEDDWPVPPKASVDFVIKEGNRVLVKLPEAVHVEELKEAPGTMFSIVDKLNDIKYALEDIMYEFVDDPGVQEQYFFAAIEAIDYMVDGDGTYCLPTVLEELENFHPTTLALLDAISASVGLLERTEELSDWMERAKGDLSYIGAVGPRSITPESSEWNVSDNSLAMQMQFYVVVKMFGEEVIANTASTFAETAGLAAGLIGIGRGIPQAAITQVILNYIDFVVNKIIVGLLPARIEMLNLELAEEVIHPGEMTDASLNITATNIPPQITLQQLIGNVLTYLGGASASASTVESFRAVLVNTANFYLGLMQSCIASYAQANPSLNLDINLGAVVPSMTWRADIVNPVLLDCISLTPSIVTPIEDVLNWEASEDEYGEGRVYIRPSLSEDARLVSSPFGYTGGAFGLDVVNSTTKSVWVKPELALEVSIPSPINEDGAGVLDVNAGYYQLDGSVNWSAGIDITVEAAGGTPEEMSGVTDANGQFTTVVWADVEDAFEIVIKVTAEGEELAFAEATVEAQIDWGNLACNPSREGYPHPLDSDAGWGGGSDVWDIVDCNRSYTNWANGLAFTGGINGYAGECGWRQATIDFGEPTAFNTVMIWHHTAGVKHVPRTYKIQVWDGSEWMDVFSTADGLSYVREDLRIQGGGYYVSVPTYNTFPEVTASKVRFYMDNCDTEHGWIYAFEVFNR